MRGPPMPTNSQLRQMFAQRSDQLAAEQIARCLAGDHADGAAVAPRAQRMMPRVD